MDQTILHIASVAAIVAGVSAVICTMGACWYMAKL